MGELTGSIGGFQFEHTESLLLVRLKEHDEAAFAQVFRLYKSLVYNLSSKLLADKAEAMDVTQEVFLTLHRKIHEFRGDCSLKTWLYRVTVNQAANRNRWWRRRLRHRTISLDLDLRKDGRGVTEPVSEDAAGDRKIFSLEIQKALQESLKQLPFEQRAAVTMRDVQGLSYEEIAQVMGSRVGTVKSRIARGRERLRELLKPYRNGLPRSGSSGADL